MTYAELISYSHRTLRCAGIDGEQYNTACLAEHFFGLDRVSLSLKRYDSPDPCSEKKFIDAVKKRSEGCPLQYILGMWTFMDCDFFVGEGVLIPRDDTEVCVRECIEPMRKIASPKIIDLCSGSGIIAVTLARMFPSADIYALELSTEAFKYIRKNIEYNNIKNIQTVNDDIFKYHNKFSDGYFDLIVSNPPYIKTDVIPKLQREISYEPIIALDGGADGLVFYRAIAENWLCKLKTGGCVSLEIGEEQGEDVSRLIKRKGISDVRIVKDIQGLDRVIFGTKI